MARSLGVWDVDSLLSLMPDKLFREWLTFQRLEPDGFEIENFRAAQICSVVANVQGNKTSPADFIPRRAARKSSPQQILDMLKAAFPKK